MFTSRYSRNITVDLIDLPIDKSIHLTELNLPDGVELTLLQHGDDESSDMAVVVIHKAKAVVEEEPTGAPEATEFASDQKNDENNDSEKDKETEE